MHIIDHDLLSVQEARVLSENARHAQKEISTYSQERLDQCILNIREALLRESQNLAQLAALEQSSEHWKDKALLYQFLCEALPRRMKSMRCVGLVSSNGETKVSEVGIPGGVVLSTGSPADPVSVAINHSLVALKSGNAILFSYDLITDKALRHCVTIIQDVLYAEGFPEGSLSVAAYHSDLGVKELMQCEAVSTIIVTDREDLLQLAHESRKKIIYGSIGNNPAFVEKTADLEKAAKDIIISKSFDGGILPGAEQSLVVESSVSHEFQGFLKRHGAYFLEEDEEDRLAHIVFDRQGNFRPALRGKSAEELARAAGFSVPAETKLLIVMEKYVSYKSFYVQTKWAPILVYYEESDWQNACEKCIELLLGEGKGHSLTIHSNDENVISQFTLKKPVNRVLVNSPSSLGCIGMASNFFPSVTLGSANLDLSTSGQSLTPQELCYRRQVARGTGNFEPVLMIEEEMDLSDVDTLNRACSPEMSDLICRMIKEIKGENQSSCSRDEIELMYRALSEVIGRQ